MTAPTADLEPVEWNGEPALGRRVLGIVEDMPEFAAYWAKPWIGHVRPAVEVHYDDRVFFIDDQDDAGWSKVKSGGSPRVSHKNLKVRDVRARSAVD